MSNLDPDDTQNSTKTPGTLGGMKSGGMTGGSAVAEEPLKGGLGSVSGVGSTVPTDDPVSSPTPVPEPDLSAPPAPPVVEDETAMPGAGATTGSDDTGMMGGTAGTSSTPMGSVGPSPVGSASLPSEEDEGGTPGKLGK